MLDIKDGEGDGNVIIVGQNPGQPSRDESEIYTTRASSSAEDQVMAMNEFVASKVLPKHPYYKLMRNAARELGFKGRILWTDLAKCSAANTRKLPVHEHRQTYSRCMNTWLRTELATFPSWPVLASHARRALAFAPRAATCWRATPYGLIRRLRQVVLEEQARVPSAGSLGRSTSAQGHAFLSPVTTRPLSGA